MKTILTRIYLLLLAVLALNGFPIPAADLPPLIHDVTLPEILGVEI